MIVNVKRFKFEHLQSFTAVCTHGSIRRAARVMGVRGSTVSRRIRDLELTLGVSLIERSRTGIVPTSDGLLFLAKSNSVMFALEEAFSPSTPWLDRLGE